MQLAFVAVSGTEAGMLPQLCQTRYRLPEGFRSLDTQGRYS